MALPDFDPLETTMLPSTPPFAPPTSPVVRSVAAFAALAASFGAVGTINAMAVHYSLNAAAPASMVARATETVRCNAPVAPPITRQAS
jgi:hypothetical protein